MSRLGPQQREHFRTSTPKTRFSSAAQSRRYVDGTDVGDVDGQDRQANGVGGGGHGTDGHRRDAGFNAMQRDPRDAGGFCSGGGGHPKGFSAGPQARAQGGEQRRGLGADRW